MANGCDILSFIHENRAWYFDSTRGKTRRACTELLGRLPPDVSDFIIKRKRLLLVAPGFRLAGTVRPYLVELGPGEKELRFQIIYLAPDLEHSSKRMIIGFTVGCVAAALRTVFSTSGQSSIEDLAESWGFQRDTVRVSALWHQRFRA